MPARSESAKVLAYAANIVSEKHSLGESSQWPALRTALYAISVPEQHQRLDEPTATQSGNSPAVSGFPPTMQGVLACAFENGPGVCGIFGVG